MTGNWIAKKKKQSVRSFQLAALAAMTLAPTMALANESESSSMTTEGSVTNRGHVMPMKFRSELSTGARTAAPLACTTPSCQLVNGGGQMISNVEVVQVIWGTGVQSEVMTKLAGYYTAVTNSAYFDWLKEYNGNGQQIGRGTFVKTVQITPKNTSKSLSDSQVGAEIAGQISGGALPKPTYDASGNPNTIYMIDFPPTITISLQGAQSCVQFCAYHSSVNIGGKEVPYGVHPDIYTTACAKGCGNNATTFDNVTSVHSHELIEAVTDVYNNTAWVDTTQGCGEIGDICDSGQSSCDDDKIAGYVVQKEWSNAKNTCQAFQKCASNTDCGGTAPICDASTGQCVQCTSNTNCSGATPACNTSTGTCGPCGSDADCTSGTHCATSGTNAGKCVACTSNAQCANPKPVCSTTTDTCGPCTSNADCAGNSAGTTCNTATGACGPMPSSSGGSSGSGSGSSSGGGSGSGSGSSSGGSGSGSGSSSGGTTNADGGAPGNTNDAFQSSGSNSGCAVAAHGGSSPIPWATGLALGLAALVRGKRRKS